MSESSDKFDKPNSRIFHTTYKDGDLNSINWLAMSMDVEYKDGQSAFNICHSLLKNSDVFDEFIQQFDDIFDSEFIEELKKKTVKYRKIYFVYSLHIKKITESLGPHNQLLDNDTEMELYHKLNAQETSAKDVLSKFIMRVLYPISLKYITLQKEEEVNTNLIKFIPLITSMYSIAISPFDDKGDLATDYTGFNFHKDDIVNSNIKVVDLDANPDIKQHFSDDIDKCLEISNFTLIFTLNIEFAIALVDTSVDIDGVEEFPNAIDQNDKIESYSRLFTNKSNSLLTQMLNLDFDDVSYSKSGTILDDLELIEEHVSQHQINTLLDDGDGGLVSFKIPAL